MDWLVFGDDWGRHPSTTQHLIKHLPQGDRCIWINSLGMRRPSLNRNDFGRALEKLTGGAAPGPPSRKPVAIESFHVVSPSVIPFHQSRAAQQLNRLGLKRSIAPVMRQLRFENPIIVTATPVVEAYLDLWPACRTVYLKLDDYGRLPGVDAGLIAACEPRMYEKADLIVCTARALIPPRWQEKSAYLPQGVDLDHFASADCRPKRKPVLGFFGLLAEWIDHRLVAEVARLRPDWKLEFVGPLRYLHPSLREIPTVVIRPPVPFDRLPLAVSDWAAAWIPFEVSPLTESVNPLKLREYLAIGLATHCTPLPEATAVPQVFTSGDPEKIAGWLDDVLVTDTEHERRKRRQSVQPDSWAARTEQLCELIGVHRPEPTAVYV